MGRRALLRTLNLCSILLVAVAPASWCTGVDVSLISTNSIVIAGSEFEIILFVPHPGDAFNGYDATISWDPAALTFVPTSPLSLQEGDYMTSACGATFHYFKQYTDHAQIGHSLWCQGMTLDGPGQLYLLHFIASGPPQITQVSLSFIAFYDGGYTVPSTLVTNAAIMIDGTTDAPAPRHALQLLATPNPFNPTTQIHVQTPDAGLQTILIHDVKGRLVRTLDQGEYPAGVRTIAWNGSDDRGTRLPSGSYLVTLQTPTQMATERVILLK